MQRRIGVAALGVLILLSVSGAPQAIAVAQDAEDAKKLRESDRRLLYRIKQRLAETGARVEDVRGRAALLGNDPDRLFEYVRKEIAFEPYPGIQRGPAGVLIAGRGNAADQAFLLKQLLSVSGYEARVLQGTLDDPGAGALLDAAVRALTTGGALPVPGPFGGKDVDLEKVRDLSREVGLAPDRMAEQFRQRRDEQRSDWSEVLDLTARETAFLEKQVAAGNLGGDVRDLRPELLAAVRDHFWVQWRPAAGKPWVDLDPAVAKLNAGQKAVEGAGRPVDPSAIADRIVVELKLQRKINGKSQVVQLLAHDVAIHRLLLRPMKFVIQPSQSLKPSGPDGDPKQSYDQLVAARQFQAMLKVGEETAGSKVFNMDGQVWNIQSDGRIKAAMEIRRTVERAFGGFGRKLGGGQKPELTGLWLDVRVRRGEKDVWKQRRTILDETTRKTHSPILIWDFFCQNQELTESFANGLSLAYRVRNDRPMRMLLDWLAEGGRDARDIQSVQVRQYPFDLLSMSLARQAFLRERGAAKGERYWLYFDRPNVLIRSQRVQLHPEDRSFCFCYGIDIMENGALVVGKGGKLQPDRNATMALGTFDTVLEEHKLRKLHEAESVDGTIGHFERARAEGRDVAFLPSGDAKGLAAAGIPATDAAWIAAHAEENQVVLVSKTSEAGRAPAWWSYQPTTGKVLGRISGGRGGTEARPRLRQANTEYVIVLRVISLSVCAYTIGSAIAKGKGAGVVAAHVFICYFMGMVGGGSALATAATRPAAEVAGLWALWFFQGFALNQLLAHTT